MKLSALCAAAGLAFDGPDADVTGFAIDHRKVAPGTVFGAFQGARFNAEDFIGAAVDAGAVAVVSAPDAPPGAAARFTDAEPRRLFARLAAAFFTPGPEPLVGVTGPNGKAPAVELTRQLWRMAGHRAASIGTLGVTTSDESVSTGLTTPDIVTFLGNLAGLAREGVSHVAYEASSHGLAQFRIEGPRVLAGAFTNLSRDHLDYHATMEDYFAAKMRLFDEVVTDGGTAVVWADDEWSGKAIAHASARGLSLFTVGAAGDGIRLVARTPGGLGQKLEIEHAGKLRTIELPLIGAYQAANALVAAGVVGAPGGGRGAPVGAGLAPARGRRGGQRAAGEGAFLPKRRGERGRSRHCAKQPLEGVHERLLGDEGGSDA